MRIAATLVLAGAVLAIGACAQSKKTAKASPTKDAAGPVAITALRMERGACFGRCPVYTLELNADGMARYYGKAFSTPQGIWEKNIGAGKTASLLQQFQKSRVDTCQNNYDVPVSDLPGLYYTFTFANGTSKRINNAHFGPRFLVSYAQSIDEAVKVDKTWRKVADSVTN